MGVYRVFCVLSLSFWKTHEKKQLFKKLFGSSDMVVVKKFA